MGRTRSTRECPPRRAAFACCPVAVRSAAAGPDSTVQAVVEAPQTRRTALHGHG
ncbi:hypothetical protein [Streptomyces sp. NPDC048349]|uniref:hypothetical protein n=1 Tax=Streptomyces sp. NPDC048349 TaxID=3155486 RepID=UPI00341F2185